MFSYPLGDPESDGKGSIIAGSLFVVPVIIDHSPAVAAVIDYALQLS
jgi:hypothetical protein